MSLILLLYFALVHKNKLNTENIIYIIYSSNHLLSNYYKKNKIQSTQRKFTF